MAVEIRLSAAEVARVRFAISPLAETALGTRLLLRGGDHPVHRAWSRDSRAHLAGESELPLLRALLAGPLASFLFPVPESRTVDLASELRRLRATDPEYVRSELAAIGREPVLARLDGGASELLDRLAAALHRTYEALLAPHWGRMRVILEADIAARARSLVERGVEGVFAELHRDVAWREGELWVRGRPGSHGVCTVEAAGHGLVLMPTVFGWPDALADSTPSTAASIRYPATGVGQLWERPSAASRELAPAIGRSRAALLDLLAEPLTTGQLAARLGVTPSAVSQHLTTLRGAGLVTTRREGRSALHLRTESGALLVRRATG